MRVAIEANESSAAGLAEQLRSTIAASIERSAQHRKASKRGAHDISNSRPRRLRRTEALRGLVRETRLSTSGLVYPMFACPGTKVRTEVSSMPGIFQQSVDQIVEECREVAGLGIPAVILFGLPEHKDEVGSEASAAEWRGAARD